MKRQKLFILFSLTVLCLSGCSKTEKDNSFDTDLYGTYSNNIKASNVDYTLKVSHTFDKDDNYIGKYYEKSDGKVLKNSQYNAKIINIENINNDIKKITTDEKKTYLSGKTTLSTDFYKYKNMLGRFYKTDVPDNKTFDLFLKNEESDVNEGLVFNKDGQYHYCTNYDNCTDDSSTFTKYKHKGDYIYQADSDGNWTILLYVVEDGLFGEEYTKSEE
ncbi:MAG: hypothetical protein PUD90_01870 [Clostridia bacterium]|nr:hypothetical protein [Clostridia bacterium]